MKNLFSFLFSIVILVACSSEGKVYDASGTFEAEEVIVSSELSGQLLSLNVNEGDSIGKGQIVGTIDADNILLQKQQVQATVQSLSEKTADVTSEIKLLNSQLTVQQSQLNNLIYERDRVERLVKADAATGKQLDDLNAQVDILRNQMLVTQRQIVVQRNQVNTQNRTILSEAKPMQKQVEQLDEQLSKSKVVNPINGIVITKYVEQGEFTSPGKALYKIADLSILTLRAYVTGSQFSQIKLNQKAKVLVDNGKKDYRTYNGTITWISNKAEFTPKTIQTKEERENLVYAVKIRIANDGYLKIGMFAEVDFEND